jgi:hypothetical protein
VDRANASAGKHCVGGLWDHGHIYTHSITLFNATLAQSIGQLANAFVKLLVGNVCIVRGLITFPNNGGLVGSGWKVPVYAVDAYI